MNCCLAVLLFCRYLSTIKAIVTDTVPDFASLCPSSVCNSTRGETEKAESCCQRCSCTLDCYKVGSCCPDILVDESIEPEYSCIDIVKLSNEGRGIDYETILHEESYRLVDKCPNEESIQAYPRCASPSNFEDYVPVSDVSYEKVFRNRHCAICHGVGDVIPWQLSVRCADLAFTAFETFEERNEFIVKHCQIEPIPPDNEKAEMSRCHTNTVNTCNTSGDWNYYDPHLEKACSTKKSFQNTVYTEYHVEHGLESYFSNVYCFLCNKPKHFDRTDVCKKREDITGSRFLLISFKAVIQWFPEEAATGSSQCRSMDIWDPFDNVCRRLYCPIGTTPENGRCNSSWEYSEGFSMGVLFEVEAPEADDIIFFSHFMAAASEAVMRILGPDFNCGSCLGKRYRYLNETEVSLIEIAFFTTKSCSVSYLIAKLRGVALKENITMTWPTVDKSVSINMKVILKDVQDHIEEVFVHYHTMYRYKHCRRPLQLNYVTMNTCPSVKLSRYAFDQFCPNQSQLKSSLWNASWIDSENSMISMCTDDYFLLRDCALTARVSTSGCQKVDKNMVINILFILPIYQKLRMPFF